MRGFGKPAPPDAADSPALIASGSTWSAMAQSQGFSNEELARHAIWGMPAVNYDLTFSERRSARLRATSTRSSTVQKATMRV